MVFKTYSIADCPGLLFRNDALKTDYTEALNQPKRGVGDGMEAERSEEVAAWGRLWPVIPSG